MPSYRQVIDTFIAGYAIPENAIARLKFAKKKDGWHVYVTSTDLREIESTGLFWSVENMSYVELPAAFRRSLSAKPATTLTWKRIFLEEYSYPYHRSPYFGYAEWREDLIKDFEGKAGLSDTLLEVLARVHTTPTHFDFEKNKADSLPVETNSIAIPASSVKDSIHLAVTTGLGYYRQILQRNPGFQTNYGSIGSSVFIEEMHYYLSLLIWGEDINARQWLNQITVPEPIKLIGRNFLDNCAVNSIFFMKDPEEMFPALYVQAKENLRNDVTLVALSGLDTPLYLQWLQQKKSLLFRTAPFIYGGDDWDIMIRIAKGDFFNHVSLFARDFFQIIEKKEQPYMTKTGKAMAAYSASRLILPIDSVKAVKQGVVLRTNALDWKLPPMLLLREYLVFDIICSNFPSRAIHFSRKAELFEDYYSRTLFTHALSPAKVELPDAKHAMRVEPLLKKYRAVLDSRDSNFQYYPIRLNDIYTRLYYEISMGYLNSNDVAKARVWCRNYLASLQNRKPVYSIHTGVMAIALMRAGLNKEGIELLEKVAEDLVKYEKANELHFPHLQSPTSGRDATTLLVVEDYLGLITARKLDSKKLKSLVKELKQNTVSQ
jgi:hypothetical protein